MNKLLGMYNKLPREIRLMVGMAGLATPIGIIFFMQRYLFKGAPIWLITLGVAAVIGVLSLLGWGISRLFGRASRKRTKKLESDLAGEAEAGRVSMDLRAAVKSNNEKFFTAIKDMRKLGISVYDLPWYIVIGDSGCGKTKLINEGGLTFSTGKPEGYQLGTLNYNWWFTEDAIFVDMAGRLCNPQEDADRREWESFLRTIATGRRGYPINGVLCCVSAEHLLQESPEQHEADANTLLERLRDLQNKLGVTFATYLVVTKCDKIVGFMQFFDRAERDITIKNQIFGWSRPGDFGELRDPELFSSDFDGVYSRLNELRLRRLNDEVDEFELGMAYSFPEEFRQLKEPLLTYVRALFPAIKSPRAVKNLIFRGVYFTSATQQGGLILRHLAERLGADVADQFPPLESMYPRPRPHFVKDLLFRKVFPEHGLVFRNEQEVVRNRKLARLLTVGTAAIGVALVTLLVVSAVQFGRLIADPREHAGQSRGVVEQPLTAAFEHARTLDRDVSTLRASKWPLFLSLGIGASRPANDLSTIQLRVFERGVLRRALESADHALRTGGVGVLPAGDRVSIPFDAFRGALREYLRWHGCAWSASVPQGALEADSFQTLCGAASATPGVAALLSEQGLEQTRRYFSAIGDRRGWSHPAMLLRDGGFDPAATIRAAVAALHEYLSAYATLTETNPDPLIAEWMRLRAACARIDAAYSAILSAAESPIETQEQLESFAQVFGEHYTAFQQALAELTWKGPRPGTYLRIALLRDALRGQLANWRGYQQELLDAYGTCGGSLEGAPDGSGVSPEVSAGVQAVRTLVAGDGANLRGLQRVLWENLVAAGLAEERAYDPEYFGEAFDKLVREVDDAYGHILAVARAGESPADDRLALTTDLTDTVGGVLARVHERLAGGTGGRAPETPGEWLAVFQELFDPALAGGAAVLSAEVLERLDPRWQRARLERLNNTYLGLISKSRATALLEKMETLLEPSRTWGLAELAPRWREPQSSAYTIAIPMAPDAAPAPREEAAPSAPPPKAPAGLPPLGRPTVPPAGPRPAEPPRPAPDLPRTVGLAGAGQIPGCASPDFLNDRARECVQLMWCLGHLEPRQYFARAGETPPRNQRCLGLLEASWKQYCEAYVDQWKVAYESKSLSELARVTRVSTSWEALASQFQTSPGRAQVDERAVVRDEFQPALTQALQALPWALYSARDGWQPDPQDPYYGAQNRRVLETYNGALRDRWPGAAFARNARTAETTAAPNLQPWERVSEEFAQRWRDWCTAAGAAAPLPRRFDSSTLPTFAPIRWDEITKLQDETGLQDERITGAIVAFQKTAQDLLNAELTGRFCAIQADTLGDVAPYEGWPYTVAQGSGMTALETVPFDQFARLLNLVHQADETLKPLEQGLPEDDPVRRARRTFVEACARWREFLRLSPQGAAVPLELEVSTADPVGAPYGQERVDDSAQHWYARVRLALGLEWQKVAGQAGTDPLVFETVAEAWGRPVRTVWKWTTSLEQPDISFELVDGIESERGFVSPRINARALGRNSALALCAFLHRYGVYHDGNWVVTFGIRLADAFTAAGKSDLIPRLPEPGWTVGMKFYLRLSPGRELPDPIVKLAPTPGAAPSAP